MHSRSQTDQAAPVADVASVSADILELFERLDCDKPYPAALAIMVDQVLQYGPDLEARYAGLNAPDTYRDLREAVANYVWRRREDSDPVELASRLTTEAAERERWAVKHDAEAAYRQRVADDKRADEWTVKNAPEWIAEYQNRADSERDFSASCRAIAERKLARAKAILNVRQTVAA